MVSQEEFWSRHDAIEARLSAPLSERMLDLAGLRPGMRVLDLATGRGEPALRAAHRVAPGGAVLGVDADPGVLRLASEAAVQQGVHNLDLRVASAEALDDLPARSFDAVTCRWGLMYMSEPAAALRHVARALADDGRFVASLWAQPERVAWHTLPRQLLVRHRLLPPFAPDAPGPFRFADPERTARDFAACGLGIEHSEDLHVDVFEAATLPEVLEWVRALGLQTLLQGLPAETVRCWEDDLGAALERGRTDGMFRLGGTTRLVVARRERGVWGGT